MAERVVNVQLNINIDPARQEALRLATQFVDGQMLPQKNERGYRDGIWPNMSDRIHCILKVADWLLTQPTILRPPPGPHGSFHTDEACPGPPECM